MKPTFLLFPVCFCEHGRKLCSITSFQCCSLYLHLSALFSCFIQNVTAKTIHLSLLEPFQISALIPLSLQHTLSTFSLSLLWEFSKTCSTNYLFACILWSNTTIKFSFLKRFYPVCCSWCFRFPSKKTYTVPCLSLQIHNTRQAQMHQARSPIGLALILTVVWQMLSRSSETYCLKEGSISYHVK